MSTDPRAADKARAQFEGHFSMESLLCGLFGTARTDASASHQTEHVSEQPDWSFSAELVRVHFMVSEATGARHGRESLPTQVLPEDVRAAAAAILFHERVHYWQLLSLPFLQLRFVNFLDRLRHELTVSGCRRNAVCSHRLEATPRQARRLHEGWAAIESNFGVHQVTANMVQSLNPIRGAKLTAMPYVLLPHAAGEDTRLPGYAGVLGFEREAKGFVVPFMAHHLLESAAFVSECLFVGREVPRLGAESDPDQQTYLGPWEFWCRVHGPRTVDARCLALGFLAAVDLAMSPDHIEPQFCTDDEQYETSSIPYRFGKLVYRAQGFRPFSIEGSDEATAVAAFQSEFCAYSGWPLPAQTHRKAVVALLKLLFSSLIGWLPEKRTAQEILDLIRDRTITELASDTPAQSKMMELLTLAHEHVRATRYPIGKGVLGAMLNSAMYRVAHPGRFALPHVHVEELSRLFPLPLVVYRGEFYLESVESVGGVGTQWKHSALELLFDAVSLAVLHPLARGTRSCGFQIKGADCYYTSQGAGCPYVGLSSEEADARHRYELHDWCHWTLRQIETGIAPPELARRWPGL